MANVEFKLQGLDNIRDQLKKLPKEVQGKPARSALGKAAAVIRQQAALNAAAIDDPETGRRISDNLIQRWRSKYYKRTGDMMISVGVGTEKGAIPKGNPDTGRKGNTPHWHLIEQGTETIRPQPFLRSAGQQKAQDALDTFTSEMSRAIDRVAKKVAKGKK